MNAATTRLHPAFSPSPAAPAPLLQGAAFVVVALGLLRWAAPSVALVSGILFALLLGHPFARWNHRVSKVLLQTCVVLLGFGIDLPVVLLLGLDGSLFAAVTIGATLLLGYWLGRRFALNRHTGLLIAAGTAICGGSAIAAVSTVIVASEAEIAVSIGTIFLLNAVALYVFPVVGHLLHLSQPQFGLWSGIAIQDISSVVGAGLSYGPLALATATAVKLSRTLWIIPLTFALALGQQRNPTAAPGAVRPKIAVPWFIGLFLLASLARSYVPAIAAWSPWTSAVAGHGLVLVLFLIGTSLSLRALRIVGCPTVIVGALLALFLSVTSLLAITCLHLG